MNLLRRRMRDGDRRKVHYNRFLFMLFGIHTGVSACAVPCVAVSARESRKGNDLWRP